eukprot:864183-Rhodomonas_salina.1
MRKSYVESDNGYKASGPGRSNVVESALAVMMCQMQASTEALLAKAPAAAKDDGKQPASDKDGKALQVASYLSKIVPPNVQFVFEGDSA